MHLRRYKLLMLYAAALALPPAPGSTQVTRGRDSMSPQGQIVFKTFYEHPNPELKRCFDTRKVIERQLIDEGKKTTFDWPTAKALLEKQIDEQVKCSKMAQTSFIASMEQLPADDRALFFRGLHHEVSAPIIVESKKPTQ